MISDAQLQRAHLQERGVGGANLPRNRNIWDKRRRGRAFTLGVKGTPLTQVRDFNFNGLRAATVKYQI